MFSFNTKIPSISVEKVHEEFEPHNNIVLLDVREPFEYEEVHIKNSILLPLRELEQKIEELVPRKETPIFAYCRSGNRSLKAVQNLLKLGYTNVFNITGGIIAWEEKQYSLETQKHSTDQF